jgi:hypothetical protein
MENARQVIFVDLQPAQSFVMQCHLNIELRDLTYFLDERKTV